MEVIHSHSPQAKGRCELCDSSRAAFRDVTGPFSERAAVGIYTKEAANRFLLMYWPKYNGQFNAIARSSVDLHRPVLSWTLSISGISEVTDYSHFAGNRPGFFEYRPRNSTFKKAKLPRKPYTAPLSGNLRIG